MWCKKVQRAMAPLSKYSHPTHAGEIQFCLVVSDFLSGVKLWGLIRR